MTTIGHGCVLDGMSVSYDCMVTDPSSPPIRSTVWLGSAFNCPLASLQITLLHPHFGSGVSDSCGGLTAMSVGVSGTEYTSRLTLTATDELNGKTINCTLSGVVLEGSDTIRVGGESILRLG